MDIKKILQLFKLAIQSSYTTKPSNTRLWYRAYKCSIRSFRFLILFGHIVSFLLSKERSANLIGDLLEEYQEISARLTKPEAERWLYKQFLTSLRPIYTLFVHKRFSFGAAALKGMAHRLLAAIVVIVKYVHSFSLVSRPYHFNTTPPMAVLSVSLAFILFGVIWLGRDLLLISNPSDIKSVPKMAQKRDDLPEVLIPDAPRSLRPPSVSLTPKVHPPARGSRRQPSPLIASLKIELEENIRGSSKLPKREGVPPNSLIQLTIVLPTYSEAGVYRIRLEDPFSKVLWESNSITSDGQTLTARIDTRWLSGTKGRISVSHEREVIGYCSIVKKKKGTFRSRGD